MVHPGRPSRACQTCKDRRTKCDLSYPHCSRCVRSGRECPGVARPGDVVFRHQTGTPPGSRPSSGGSKRRGSSQRSTPAPVEISTDTLIRRLSQSPLNFTGPQWDKCYIKDLDNYTTQVTQIAMNYWINNYLITQHRSGHYDSFYGDMAVCFSKATSTSPIYVTVMAMSLASMSKYDEFTHASKDAHIAYGRALNMVASNLRDPVKSKSTETLLCVLLMSMYEVITRSQESATSYDRHLIGAMKLLSHRHRSQESNQQDRLILKHVRPLIIATCIRNAEPIDPICLDTADYKDETIQLPQVLVPSLADLRVRTNEVLQRVQSPETLSEAACLIAQAKKLDSILCAWYKRLPNSLLPIVIDSSIGTMPSEVENEDVWLGTIHTYREVGHAHLFSNYRILRIFIQEIVLRCTLWLDPLREDIAELQEVYILRHMVDEICASVPFLLGYHKKRKLTPADDTTLGKMATEAMGGYFLLWPLHSILIAPFVPTLQRRWALGRMRLLWERYQYGQARIWSEELSEDIKLSTTLT